MTADLIFNYLMDEAPVIASVGLAVWFISNQINKRSLADAKDEKRKALQDARLANSIDGLTKKLDEVIETIKHMDGRLDHHETEIALLKQKQDAA